MLSLASCVVDRVCSCHVVAGLRTLFPSARPFVFFSHLADCGLRQSSRSTSSSTSTSASRSTTRSTSTIASTSRSTSTSTSTTSSTTSTSTTCSLTPRLKLFTSAKDSGRSTPEGLSKSLSGNHSPRENMEDVQCRLRTVQVQITRLRRQQRRASEKVSVPLGSRCPVSFRTALALQALAPKDEAAAREYVATLHGAGICKEEWKSLKFAALLQEHGEAGRDSLLSPKTQLGKRALCKARKFLQERDLRNWVRSANLEKGLAPKGRDLRAEYRRLDLSRDDEETRGNRCDKKHWLRRWARRWLEREEGQITNRGAPFRSRIGDEGGSVCSAPFCNQKPPIFGIVCRPARGRFWP
jgi:hypothetical protein